MSEKSLIDAISHYQKDIDRCPSNKERMLRCIKRLYVMPIKVEHLQATGIGRSVNNLREISGDVGEAATALVSKWKAMVTAEDLNEEEDSSPEETVEEDEDIPTEKSNSRVSPDDSSVKDKENIRSNHRTDKIKPNKLDLTDKSEKHIKTPEKHSKESRTSTHSSKDRESSSKKDSSSNKNHSNGNSDKKYKDKTVEKSRESSKSDKDKKHREDKDKHHSRDKSNNSSKDRHKEAVKEKDKSSKHLSSSSKDKSSSSSKDKVSSSRDKESSRKDRSTDKFKEPKDKVVKKEKRERSREREKESRKCEKRKHQDKERECDKPVKKIKREKRSSDEEDSDRDSDRGSDRESHISPERDSEDDQSSDDGGDSDNSASRSSDSDRDSAPESYSKVKIKQEPLSDSDSDSEHNTKKRSVPEKRPRNSEEMKPPPSRKDLKSLIKENEKKIKKEKQDHTSNDKVKKSKVKIEMNQDGSIDSGSGASFADALMGFDSAPSGSPKKKKKKEDRHRDSGCRPSATSTPSGSQASHSGPSRSPSQASTASSYRSSASPSKQEKKPILTDPSRETPEALLKKPVKLEPLNLDISSTLPEISTNYKPLPSIQSRHTPVQQMSEEQMFSIMTSKNQRTKVYSGYKYGQTLSVPSLYSLCIQVLYDNIDGLEYTGGVPFDILKPLLIKLNGEQLLNLEHYNPYLVDDTDDLWKFHCNKTFPKAGRDDMETWRETYLRSMDERELKLKRLTANITESMAIKGPARQAKLAYVDSVAKPPRNIARKQAKYGTGSGSPAASTSGASISQIAAAQNQAKKKEIVSKAVVGGFTPSTPATEQVPAYNNPATAAKILKKKKAPLMAKALQLIKGNRFKR